jgi:MFS family permease
MTQWSYHEYVSCFTGSRRPDIAVNRPDAALIDTSITNVALDAITHSLHATATELELIVALYGVAFAVCLALGSKLGDNLGRRRLFMWGVASFGLASLLCGMAGNIEQLLAARIVQGAGAALIMPQISPRCTSR